MFEIAQQKAYLFRNNCMPIFRQITNIRKFLGRKFHIVRLIIPIHKAQYTKNDFKFTANSRYCLNLLIQENLSSDKEIY